jgi:hypothetical protein
VVACVDGTGDPEVLFGLRRAQVRCQVQSVHRTGLADCNRTPLSVLAWLRTGFFLYRSINKKSKNPGINPFPMLGEVVGAVGFDSVVKGGTL